jgi:hypothetical protein
MGEWTDWKLFPVPSEGGYLNAPFGPGVYELMNRNTGKKVLFGMGKNTAARMSSLLPAPHGCGRRNNSEKRKYIFNNLKDVLYRTKSCTTREEAVIEEALLKRRRDDYMFSD